MHTPVRPTTLVFDVIETLFSLEPVRGVFVAAGLPPQALEWWFAEALRTGFSLAVLDRFEPFSDVALTTLESLVARAALDVDEGWPERVLAAMSELPSNPDAAPALEKAAAAGVRVLALTNGSAKNTRTLFERAGLADLVERVVSIDEPRRWKPRPEPYLRAAAVAGEEPRNMALVAVHSWDVAGAREAGLTTGWASRHERVLPRWVDPDVVAATVDAVVAELFALG